MKKWIKIFLLFVSLFLLSGTALAAQEQDPPESEEVYTDDPSEEPAISIEEPDPAIESEDPAPTDSEEFPSPEVTHNGAAASTSPVVNHATESQEPESSEGLDGEETSDPLEEDEASMSLTPDMFGDPGETASTFVSPSPSPSESASPSPTYKVSTKIQETKEYVEENEWARILINIALILILTYAVAYGAKKLWERNRKNSQYLFRKFVYYLVQTCIYVVGVLCAIGQIPLLSQAVQTILAGSGILALAVSLSAQESLSNVISGMFITMFKPFEVGDRVTLVSSKVVGTIEDITLRHTIIKTFTNTRLVVPNSTMNQEMLENYNIMDARAAAFLDVSVAYESDLDLAMNIMADVIGNHPLYLDVRTPEEMETKPKVTVYVQNLGASGVELRSTMWTKSVSENYTACCEARLQIKKAFDAAGIEIPYTKYTILRQEDRQKGPAQSISISKKDEDSPA